MDRKAACLLQAAACRERAAADPLNHDYWVDEAIKWLELAHAPATPVVVTIELRPNDRCVDIISNQSRSTASPIRMEHEGKHNE
ncbi:hypothetical protein [Bradyrhizobium manausense]|nr:hypothetical protein [Bradyrhizobium manausense]MBR0722760.1 hypothetical protein [Bradyrhizobium manausense]